MIKPVDSNATPAPTARGPRPRSKSFRNHLVTAHAIAQPGQLPVATTAPHPTAPAASTLDADTQAAIDTAHGATTAAAIPPHGDSPVAALLAAVVGRAIGSLRTSTPAGTPAPAAVAQPAATDDATSAIALTPLEQAVHDLIGAIASHPVEHELEPTADRDRDPAEPPLPALAAPANVPVRTDAAPRPAHAAAPASPVALPEPLANPSHVHLVLDDGPERVVVTVAVRGSDVHVALRGTDDTTAAALARNAAALDHAMRARGLQLADFTAEHEHRERPRDTDPEPRRERRPDTERFTLEETP